MIPPDYKSRIEEFRKPVEAEEPEPWTEEEVIATAAIIWKRLGLINETKEMYELRVVLPR